LWHFSRLEDCIKPTALVCTMLLVFAGAALAAPAQPVLKLSVPFEGPMALAVLDARPDVVSGERKETFVGFTRSLYGIPYPAHTQSKKPFAQDLSNLVNRALKLGKTPAESIVVSPFGGRQAALDALRKSGAERLLLVEIRDWWSDTLIHTDLHYDLLLTVFNAEGQELGSTTVVGHDELGKRQRPERRDITIATNNILETLFAAETVIASFSPEAAPAAKAAGCTVEQVLKMKEAGLTQEQIEAACGPVAGR
jgi:hypothetical protein